MEATLARDEVEGEAWCCNCRLDELRFDVDFLLLLEFVWDRSLLTLPLVGLWSRSRLSRSRRLLLVLLPPFLEELTRLLLLLKLLLELLLPPAPPEDGRRLDDPLSRLLLPLLRLLLPVPLVLLLL